MKNTKKHSKIAKIDTWNYRVLNHGDYCAVHEVYYDKKRKIITWTEEAVIPIGDDIGELKKELIYYMLSIARPVLKVKGNKLYEDKK